MQKKWILLIGVLAFILVLGIGAIAGGGIAYFLLQKDIPTVLAAPVDAVLEGGVIISHVEEDSPAAKAGLVRGDILLEIGEEAVNNFPELRSALSGYDPGETVDLTVQHGDDMLTMSATLGDLDGNPYLGITICSGLLPRFMIDREPQNFEKAIKVITTAGARITDVVKGSPADKAALEVGDVIFSVNGDEISSESSLADLIQQYQPGDLVELNISRGVDEMDVEVELGENPDVTGQAYLGVYYQPMLPHLMRNFDGEKRFFDLPDIPFHKEIPFIPQDLPTMPGFEQLPDGVENAIIIGEVLKGTPAEGADLRVDDLIIYLDGEPVEGIKSFVSEISSHEPGDRVTLTIFRGGEEFEVTVTLTEHPDNPESGYLGIKAAGFIKIKVDGEIPGDLEYDFEKEFELPGGDV